METAEILSIVKSLSRTRNICKYLKVDLHVHSPASVDYKGDKSVTPHQFVSSFIERGFDLIAITDHNTGAHIDQILEAQRRIAATAGDNITILPGVEICVSPGVHLLAILPDGGSAAVSDLLSRLGLALEEHGTTEGLITVPIDELANIVRGRGGLLIGAHANSNKGVVQELAGQARLQWLKVLDALEISSESQEENISKTIDYVRNSLKSAIPFVFGSDTHDCQSASIGMWVKMADPSLISLRQLTYEPDLRVSRTEPEVPAHGRIGGFVVSHGIYIDQRFRFSPHLNVIVGGRGGGKSAVIDLLRFAFEAEPRTANDIDDVFANRIMGFLQSVGEVLVLVIGSDGEEYVIVRSGAYEKLTSRARPTFTSAALVFQVVEDNLVPRELRPADVLGIEFYGQGEAAQLANRVTEQMRLIDENLDHSSALTLISEANHQLTVDETSVLYPKYAGKSGRRWPGFGRRSGSRQKVLDPRW